MGIKQAVTVRLNFNQKSVIVGLNINKIDESRLSWKHVSYIMGTCALPDTYTLAIGPAALGLMRPLGLSSPRVCAALRLMRICQAKHLCPWYNYYIYK